MALINIKSFLANKINSLQEKNSADKELLEFTKRSLTEKNNQKYLNLEAKLNKQIAKEEFKISDIETEVNKRLPSVMLRYNKKDYWKRRALIQKMKVTRDTDPEAFNRYESARIELDRQKSSSEALKREKLKNKLLKSIVTEESQINEAKKNIESLKAKKEMELTNFIKDNNVKLENKFKSLDDKHNSKEQRLLSKVNLLKEKLGKLSKDEYTLDENVLLKVDHLTMQFGGLKAVDDLSFEVKKGEIFGLIGPNGAGKTTVFNCITQFYNPTKGNVYFQDHGGSTILLNDIKVHDVVKKGIVRTFQNVEVVKEVTVLENLLIAAHTQYHSTLFSQFLHLPILKKEELAIRQKALEVLEFLGLSLYKDYLAWGLPYGILKKIEIARTLMNNPQLIILDEPAAGLNDSETAELAELIKKIQDKYNCAILLVEHDMGLVMDICDTVCAISFGKMLAVGTTEEIQNNKDVQSAYLGTAEE